MAAAKAKPGQLNYASAGVGSGTHLNAEIFRLQAGIEALHVPYKGTPDAMTNVIGGSNDWFFAPLASALPLIRDGKLQALSVSTTDARLHPAAGADHHRSRRARLPTTRFWVGMIVAQRHAGGRWSSACTRRRSRPWPAPRSRSAWPSSAPIPSR